MSQSKAREARRELRAQGIDPFDLGPGPNFTDLPDTREQRRTKRFRPRQHALEMQRTSILGVFQDRIRWIKAFSLLPKKETTVA